jgi:D-3-phosphoglycerate dehydrogenase
MAEGWKIVVTDYIEPDLEFERAEMERRGAVLEFDQLKFRPEEEVIAACRDADILVVNMVKITKTVVAELEQCRLVIRHGAGYDNVDVAALTERGIPLGYEPDYCSEEVAEQAVGLLFACARQIPHSRGILDESIRQRKWDFGELQLSYRMRGSTLGILGCGRIGSCVLEKLRGFGFGEILVCDPYLAPERVQELGVRMVDRETLFREADYLTVHTPLTDETRRIVNAETLRLMKPSAVLVNTSRGPMVDHEALAEALREGRLRAAGIDVYDTEPPEETYPLLDLPNAVLTPHLAWYSEDSAHLIREMIVEDIDRCMKGLPPRHCVNPEALERQKEG